MSYISHAEHLAAVCRFRSQRRLPAATPNHRLDEQEHLQKARYGTAGKVCSDKEYGTGARLLFQSWWHHTNMHIP
jgi:hypothetical protein